MTQATIDLQGAGRALQMKMMEDWEDGNVFGNMDFDEYLDYEYSDHIESLIEYWKDPFYVEAFEEIEDQFDIAITPQQYKLATDSVDHLNADFYNGDYVSITHLKEFLWERGTSEEDIEIVSEIIAI